MNRFLQYQGVTKTLYPLGYCKEEATQRSRKAAIARRVVAVLPPRGVSPRSQCVQYSSLVKPCEVDKIASNAGWRYC